MVSGRCGGVFGASHQKHPRPSVCPRRFLESILFQPNVEYNKCEIWCIFTSGEFEKEDHE